MEPILIIVLVVVAILNLILFFKVWGMTNNTIKIRAISSLPIEFILNLMG